MTTTLDALIALQEHDTAIDVLRRRLGALPERAAAHALNERRRGADARIAELATQLDELAEIEEQVEKDLAVVEQRAKQLDDGLRAPGSATRDAQTIIHEIDHLREQAGALEERGLELLEQRDALLQGQKDAQAELDAVAAEAPGVLASVATAEGEAGQELATLEAERVALVPTVGDALVARYERMRPKMEGVAVARVVNGSCTGCHLTIAGAELERLAKLGDGEYSSCEECGRILIPS